LKNNAVHDFRVCNVNRDPIVDGADSVRLSFKQYGRGPNGI